MSADAAPPRFWLLVGDVPTGPFDATEVHRQLADGIADWGTKACPLGGGTWRALLETPGFGPVHAPPVDAVGAARSPASDPPSFTTPQVSEPAAAPSAPPFPVSPPPAPGRLGGMLGTALAIGLIATVVYGLYEWMRGYTPTEVRKKLSEAKTAEEAKKYATSRFRPVVDAIHADLGASDPNDTLEWTQEVDGPLLGSKRVGFRGSIYLQEVGRRVQLEAYMVLLKSDGWKVDDMVITGAEGMILPGPISMVEDERRQRSEKLQLPPARIEKKTGAAPAPKPPELNWFGWTSPSNKTLRGCLLLAVMLLGGIIKGKWK